MVDVPPVHSHRSLSDRESQPETCPIIPAPVRERLERVIRAVGNAAALVLHFDMDALAFAHVPGARHVRQPA